MLRNAASSSEGTKTVSSVVSEDEALIISHMPEHDII